MRDRLAEEVLENLRYANARFDMIQAQILRIERRLFTEEENMEFYKEKARAAMRKAFRFMED